jgi:hypothetical protein
MIKVSVLAAMAFVLLGSNFANASLRSNYWQNRNKAGACHTKIDPKGLKGAELKSAWKQCMVNPDNYS